MALVLVIFQFHEAYLCQLPIFAIYAVYTQPLVPTFPGLAEVHLFSLELQRPHKDEGNVVPL